MDARVTITHLSMIISQQAQDLEAAGIQLNALRQEISDLKNKDLAQKPKQS